MIEVQNLTKHYGEIVAIEDVSFSVEKGRILGFLGPNGAGKTTTMRIITGYLPPTSGSVRVAGYDVTADPMEVKRRIGYLPENPPLYPDMTVASYLRFVMKIKGVPRNLRKARLDEVLHQCGLEHHANRLIDHLSKGYRQRVGIAQAFIHRPPVIILDEPTIGLDPKQIIEIRKLIRDLAREQTIILSTHILQEVAMLCDAVVIISRGTIVMQEEMKNLHDGQGKRFLLRLGRPEKDTAQRLARIEGVGEVSGVSEASYLIGCTGPVEEVRRKVLDTIHERDWDLIELKTQERSLEEIFLQAVTETEEVAA